MKWLNGSQWATIVVFCRKNRVNNFGLNMFCDISRSTVTVQKYSKNEKNICHDRNCCRNYCRIYLKYVVYGSKIRQQQSKSTPNFPENEYFLPTVCVSGGKKCSLFWKIWCALFSSNTRFEIRLFTLLTTNCRFTENFFDAVSFCMSRSEWQQELPMQLLWKGKLPKIILMI